MWRTLPILMLTVRQLAGGRAVRAVAALAFLPCLFAAIYLIRTGGVAPAEFLITNYRELVAPTLLPITVLILATAALGNEVDDRTLPYLTMKPVSRLRIVLEKFGGVLVVALPAVLLGLLATAVIAGFGDRQAGLRAVWDAVWPVARAMVGSAAAGTVLIGAIFLAISLLVPRALLAGIVYVFAWESLLGRFLPGIQTISIRHYMLSVFSGLSDNPLAKLDDATALATALTTIAAVAAIAIAVATLRLRTMNLE